MRLVISLLRRGQVAAFGAAACFALFTTGCAVNHDAPSNESEASRAATPEPARSSTSPRGGNAAARAKAHGGLPFSFTAPKGFLRGRALDPIVASLLIDRRNAILIARFGTGAPTGAQLQRAIQSKLTAAGSRARAIVKRQPGGLDVITIDVSEFPEGNEVAGRPVAARRVYFSAGNTIWEMSCQYTRERRARVLAACGEVASSLRPA
jgi:hypothetical protein